MEIFSSIKDALEKYPGGYVSRINMGKCRICGENEGLRCGTCFDCCGKVDGKPIKNKKGKILGHRLFEIENPQNNWIVGI